VDNSPVKHFLLKFNVTGVNGQTITNAKLRVYNVDAASKGGDFYSVSDDTWDEDTVTWNNAPPADITLSGTLGAVSINTWYEVDVTSLITTDGTYSLRISDSVGGADYSSKEGANPPQLVITLAGTPTPTFTPTETQTPTPVTPTTTEVSVTPSFTPTFTPTPTGTPIPSGPITINYVYDPLNRLTEANYSNNDYYHYTYDAVGNRLNETTQLTTTNYLYDDANRIETVNGVTYDYDNNGNLKNDGVNEYEYDSANRLKTMNIGQPSATSYQYNGLGDRIQETINGQTTTFAMDLNAGLTQALSDGTNTYVYGLGRIVQSQSTATEYFLGDALGSVRQLADAGGEITLAKSYQPYGDVLSSFGSSASPFAFTGEQQDASGMVYLRARYYVPNDGRFLTRDIWEGNINTPASLNRCTYAHSNPVMYTDPSGFIPCAENQNTDISRYCILERGGYIDVGHFVPKKEAVNRLIDVDLLSQFGKHFGQITIEGPTLNWRLPFTHSATYLTALPSHGLLREELGRIALGMQMTYEYGFELAQFVDPRCYTLSGWFSHCSSFSNEDLPSDYLGMVSAIKGLTLEEMLAPNLLGPGEQSNSIPSEYWGNILPILDATSCIFGSCPDDSPVNFGCTLRIYDPNTNKYRNQPWPSELVVEPFGFGVYWGLRESDFHILPPYQPLVLHNSQVPQ